MEQLTLGDLGNAIIWISSVLGAGAAISHITIKHLRKVINEIVGGRLDKIERHIDQVDIDNTKNYLQQTISAINSGAEVDLAARERFYENYDHYTNDLHLNSWVHKEKERLEKEGKL